jgi:hypothetical protein
MLLRAAHPLEHELLHAQVVFSLASALRDMVAQTGAVRLVPLPVAPSRLIELMADEAMSKKPAREILVRAFELDNLGYAEMIKQALEMRAVVVIAKVSNAAEAAPFAESAMLDELTSSRLIVSICSNHEVPVKLPIALTERSVCKQLGAVSLVCLGLWAVQTDPADRHSASATQLDAAYTSWNQAAMAARDVVQPGDTLLDCAAHSVNLALLPQVTWTGPLANLWQDTVQDDVAAICATYLAAPTGGGARWALVASRRPDSPDPIAQQNFTRLWSLVNEPMWEIVWRNDRAVLARAR